MMVTKPYLERLIQKARDAGVDPKHIAELEDQLEDLKTSGLNKKSGGGVYQYEHIKPDGTKVVRMSTAPIDPENDHIFDDIPLRQVKHVKSTDAHSST
jgi:hypothetical protein